MMPALQTMAACPYCKDQVEGRKVVTCPSCETVHHQECWETNENVCSVYGCRSRNGDVVGCPWCDEVYPYGEHSVCLNCSSPLMSPAEYSTFIRGAEWEKLNPEEYGNPILAQGYLRNNGIVARLDKVPSIYGYFYSAPVLWVLSQHVQRARELLKDLQESLLYCETCGHVLDPEEPLCSFCQNE
jgi:hypothetical protein